MQTNDLTTLTYTFTYPGADTPTVITPTVRTREHHGVQVTVVRGLAPLLANEIDAITDEGDRLHTLIALASASIVIRDHGCEEDEWGDYGYTAFRDYGRLSTAYAGTRHLPVGVVLDLAERLRATVTPAR